MSIRSKQSGRRQAARAPTSSEPSRRALLGAGVKGAVLLSVGSGAFARASASTRTSAVTAPANSALAPAPTGSPYAVQYSSDLLALVNRAGQGFTEELFQAAQALGFQGYLAQQLDPASIDDGACDARIAILPTVSMSTKAIYDAYGVTNMASVPVAELRAAAILRAVYSKRQLFERMVEFWSDHFNIDHNKNDDRWLKTADDRDVIRAHALRTFPALLGASARSAAMLYSLDNHTNKKSAPNENYARELMELHTLGVGNFTETDVKEVARCLTGWTFKGKTDPNYGEFVFTASNHDQGAKTVLGHAIPANGGVNDGLTVLSILAQHPATARFIARKLCRWLLSYTPPQSIVDQVAATYTATGGDVQAMLRDILNAQTFAQVPATSFAKLRRPLHLVYSLLRAAAVDVSQPAKIVTELSKLGQIPFNWPAPNGYPESAEAWGNGVLPRWTLASRLFDNKITGSSVDIASLLAGIPKAGIGVRINEILAGGALAPRDQQAVQRYVNTQPNLTDAVRREAFALAASSPSYQSY